MCTSYLFIFFNLLRDGRRGPPGLLVRITQPIWMVCFYLTNIYIVVIMSDTILEDSEPLTHFL